MSAGGKDKAAYRAAGPGKMGFKKGAYGSAKGVRAKAANLSDAQLKRAGGAKAAAKRTVDIGSTSRVAGKTLGPGGKPLTGSVKLANGKMAVYKAGKRVVNKPVSVTKPKSPPPKNRPPLNMPKNAPGYGIPQKLKNADVEAKRVAASRRPAAGQAAVAPSVKNMSQYKGRSATPASGSKYATTPKRTGSSTKAEVAATLLAAGLLPLAGLAGAGGLSAAAAARAIAAGGPRAIGPAGARKAIESGVSRSVTSGSRAIGSGPSGARLAITRGTPAQRAAATKAKKKRGK